MVAGDAAYIMNPVYAQGMTGALLGSQTLANCLPEQSRLGHLTGLARTFQTQLSQAIAEPWQMVLREDQRWPATEVVESIRTIKPAPATPQLAVMGAKIGNW